MTELPFVAGALGEWLVGRIADAGMRAVARGELAAAIRAAAARAARNTAVRLVPDDADHVERMIREVFAAGPPDPAGSLSEHGFSLLEQLRADVVAQCARLDDPALTSGLDGAGEPVSATGELGLAPGELAATLFDEIYAELRRGAANDPALDRFVSRLEHDDLRGRPATGPAAVVSPRSNLPARPPVFVGREGHRAALLERCRVPGITVLRGEGGIGKSTLAVVAAHDLLDAGHLPGGVVWLDCDRYAGLAPDQFMTAVYHELMAALFDKPQAVDVPDMPALVQGALAERTALLCVDSLEAAPGDGALPRFVVECATRTPVLVTTRVVGDVLHTRSRQIRLDEMSEAESVELFAELARVRGWDGAGAAEVPALCAEAGHHPLAIELLAAAADHRTVRQLRADLRRSLEAVAVADPLRPGRHRTLAACFQASLLRLSARAVTAGRRLAWLPAGADAELAAALTADLAPDPVRELVRGSLCRFTGGRYLQHPLIRRYLADQAAGPGQPVADAIRDAAIAATVGLVAEKGAAAAPGQSQDVRGAALDWLETQWPNVLACMAWAEQAGDVAVAGVVSDAGRDFLYHRGRAADLERVHHLAIRLRRRAGDRLGLALSLANLGLCQLRQDRYGEAIATLDRSVATARAAHRHLTGPDREAAMRIEAYALADLGFLLSAEGQIGRADRVLARSLHLARRDGDHVLQGVVYSNIGVLRQHTGDWAGAVESLLASAPHRRAAGDLPGEGYTYVNLNHAYLRVGDWRAAERCAAQALDVFRRCGIHYDQVGSLLSLAIVRRDTGRWAESAATFSEALALVREQGTPVQTAGVLEHFGRLHQYAGRPHEAIALADEALLLARTAKLHVFAIRCLVLRASALLDLGRVAVARAALAQARDLVATSPTPIVPVIAMRLEMHCARAAGAEGDAALGAAHLAAADAALGSEEDPITRAQAMEMAAGVLTDLGEHALAGETLRRALATWRELDVPLLEGLVLLRLARHATLAGDNGAASAQLAAAAALLEGTEHRSALDAAR